MNPLSKDRLHQLDALNNWLVDVFDEGIRLSILLVKVGLSEEEVQEIKTQHLEDFIQAVIDLIVDNIDSYDGDRCNNVMVRHYGLLNGKPETLQSIGDSMELSRERIRQLVQKRIRYYRNHHRKEQFKTDMANIGQRLLNQRVNIVEDEM